MSQVENREPARLSLPEAAKMVGVARGTLWNAVRRGKLQAHWSGRQYLVNKNDVALWKQQCYRRAKARVKLTREMLDELGKVVAKHEWDNVPAKETVLRRGVCVERSGLLNVGGLRVFSLREATILYGVGLTTLYRHIYKGRLVAYQAENGQWFVTEASMERWLREGYKWRKRSEKIIYRGRVALRFITNTFAYSRNTMWRKLRAFLRKTFDRKGNPKAEISGDTVSLDEGGGLDANVRSVNKTKRKYVWLPPEYVTLKTPDGELIRCHISDYDRVREQIEVGKHEPEWITISEAAREFGVHRSTIWRNIQRGRLQCRHDPHRNCLCVNYHEVHAWRYSSWDGYRTRTPKESSLERFYRAEMEMKRIEERRRRVAQREERERRRWERIKQQMAQWDEQSKLRRQIEDDEERRRFLEHLARASN